MQGPNCAHVLIRDPPKRCAWLTPVPEHGCLAILGIGKKSGRSDAGRIEVIVRREESREVFLVVDRVNEARRQHVRLL